MATPLRTRQRLIRRSVVAGCLSALCLTVASVSAQAASDNASAEPAKTVAGARIGVVDLDRLMDESPQAKQARTHMARRFAQRKDALEQTAEELEVKADRLKKQGDSMSEDQRNALSSDIRDGQRQLTLKQSQYNDDVSDAEDAELKQLRSDLRSVIDAYAKAHDYDVILGESVLYAAPGVDITDQILDRLNKRP